MAVDLDPGEYTEKQLNDLYGNFMDLAGSDHSHVLLELLARELASGHIIVKGFLGLRHGTIKEKWFQRVVLRDSSEPTECRLNIGNTTMTEGKDEHYFAVDLEVQE